MKCMKCKKKTSVLTTIGSSDNGVCEDCYKDVEKFIKETSVKEEKKPKSRVVK